MEYWTLFFTGMSAIATLGLLGCTIVGFIFIRKQINIAKNKDILFSLQKDLYLYLHQFYISHAKFVGQFNLILIKHKCLKDMNPKDKHISMFEELNNYFFEFNNTRFNEFKSPLPGYEWWLIDFKNELDKIFKRKKFKRLLRFPEVYSLKINKFTKKEKCDERNEAVIKESLRKLLSEISESITCNFNDTNDEINKFLSKLAKEKRIL